MVRQAIDTFGGLDILVNNAGFVRDRMLVNTSEEEWDAVIRVHLKGHFAPLRHAGAYWRAEGKEGRQRAARVINTSSGAGLQGSVGQATYSAAKAGIAGLTLVAAQEMGRYGVTVNAIAPVARTRMTEGAFDTSAMALPEDNSPLVAWLASEEAGDVTGRVFEIDGSRSSPSRTAGRTARRATRAPLGGHRGRRRDQGHPGGGPDAGAGVRRLRLARVRGRLVGAALRRRAGRWPGARRRTAGGRADAWRSSRPCPTPAAERPPRVAGGAPPDRPADRVDPRSSASTRTLLRAPGAARPRTPARPASWSPATARSRCEWYWNDGAPDKPQEVFSVTKSVTSTLVGLAQADGDLSVDDPAADYIPEWQGTPSEAVTVRNLLSNDSGRFWSTGSDYGASSRRGTGPRTPSGSSRSATPGTVWAYNNAAIQTLDAVIRNATGRRRYQFAAGPAVRPARA